MRSVRSFTFICTNRSDNIWLPIGSQKSTKLFELIYEFYANLAAYSAQRNEGHHVAVKQFFNPKITLEQATHRLAEYLEQESRRLAAEEADSRSKLEWEAAKNASVQDSECTCTLIQQYGLPCLTNYYWP